MSTLFYKKSILMKPEELECIDLSEFLSQNQGYIEENTVFGEDNSCFDILYIGDVKQH